MSKRSTGCLAKHRAGGARGASLTMMNNAMLMKWGTPMMDWDRATAELNKPLDRSNVSDRQQAGRKLSYIEGWHAIAEANRIFGHDGWHRESELTQLGEPYTNAKGNWVVNYMGKCRITISNEGIGVLREGCGFGSGIDADLGRAHESAIKEAETDATKRALMTFGWPFGLALYDKTQEHVSP
jgi:DNA repair and recombination protein RAD52